MKENDKTQESLSKVVINCLSLFYLIPYRIPYKINKK